MALVRLLLIVQRATTVLDMSLGIIWGCATIRLLIQVQHLMHMHMGMLTLRVNGAQLWHITMLVQQQA